MEYAGAVMSSDEAPISYLDKVTLILQFFDLFSPFFERGQSKFTELKGQTRLNYACRRIFKKINSRISHVIGEL